LNVDQIIAGLPHQWQLVRMKLLNGVLAVFIPDTNKIFNQCILESQFI